MFISTYTYIRVNIYYSNGTTTSYRQVAIGDGRCVASIFVVYEIWRADPFTTAISAVPNTSWYSANNPFYRIRADFSSKPKTEARWPVVGGGGGEKSISKHIRWPCRQLITRTRTRHEHHHHPAARSYRANIFVQCVRIQYKRERRPSGRMSYAQVRRPVGALIIIIKKSRDKKGDTTDRRSSLITIISIQPAERTRTQTFVNEQRRTHNNRLFYYIIEYSLLFYRVRTKDVCACRPNGIPTLACARVRAFSPFILVGVCMIWINSVCVCP